MGHILSRPLADHMNRTALRRPAEATLADLRSPDGLLHVCGWCRKVRNGENHWVGVEQGLLDEAGSALTHGVCPDCARMLFRKRREAA